MASRPVFVPLKKAPFVDVFQPEFTWSPGLAVSRKQMNIAALHDAFNRRFPRRRVLEISSKSLQPPGVALSAFHLNKFVPSLGIRVLVECVFQGGKVFAAGGPYTDLYIAAPRDARQDPRLRSGGELRNFFLRGGFCP